MKKIIFILIAVLSVFLYYFLNDSYRYSLMARAYYEFGNFDKAYEFAKEAYDMNKYNRMAFTILTQSKIAKEWQNFIDQSNKYFKQIDEISNKEMITKADKVRIKMMLEIILGEYKHLTHSMLISQSLKQQAHKNYIKAKELYNGIFKNTVR
ncbi:MAG: hypothetical protein GXO40_01035 [Epsilonproteobacteria bacterium]|nr:hypothetical protein [Campylobacterota bacterium]